MQLEITMNANVIARQKDRHMVARFLDLGLARARGSNVSKLANVGIEARF